MKMAADNTYRLWRRSNSSPGLSGAEVITVGRFERGCRCMHQSFPAVARLAPPGGDAGVWPSTILIAGCWT
jgi:hypothetical protein